MNDRQFALKKCREVAESIGDLYRDYAFPGPEGRYLLTEEGYKVCLRFPFDNHPDLVVVVTVPNALNKKEDRTMSLKYGDWVAVQHGFYKGQTVKLLRKIVIGGINSPLGSISGHTEYECELVHEKDTPTVIILESEIDK